MKCTFQERTVRCLRMPTNKNQVRAGEVGIDKKKTPPRVGAPP
jgi:hypothetical protein